GSFPQRCAVRISALSSANNMTHLAAPFVRRTSRPSESKFDGISVKSFGESRWRLVVPDGEALSSATGALQQLLYEGWDSRRLVFREASKTVTLQLESSTYPNQLSVSQKRV